MSLFFWGTAGREGAGILSAPQHLNFVFLFPTNTVVTGPGLYPQGMETGMIPK